MERIRLDQCSRLEIIVNGLSRIIRDLVEASDRIPAGSNGRPLVDGALNLALGLYNVGVEALRDCKKSVSSGHGIGGPDGKA